jgi:hypothetical protein
VYNASQPVGSSPWLFLSPAARRARFQLAESSEQLGAYGGVYQGIKTGANDVFVLEIETSTGSSLAQVRNGFGEVFFVEPALLHPVTYGSNLQRYDSVSADRYLLYPYEFNTVIPESVLREEYPHTYAYLTSYRTLLAERSSIAEGGLKWYELVRKRDETWLSSKKLMIRDLATKPSFTIDEGGHVFLVGGSAVVPVNQELLFPLLGYLNSSVVGWYLAQITPLFRSGFQRIDPQYIREIPVLQEVIESDDLREALGELAYLVIEAKKAGDIAKQGDHEKSIDHLLFERVGLDLTEIP